MSDPSPDFPEQTFLDLFPFAVDASTFREVFFTRTAIVKREIKKYLEAQQSSRAPSGLAGRLLINVATTSPSSDAESPEDKIDRLDFFIDHFFGSEV